MKKWIAIGIVAILVIAGAVYIFQDRQLTPEEELVRELEKFAVNGEEITGRIILPPEARGVLKIEYRVDEEGLRWGVLSLRVRATNIGDREIRRGEFVFYLTDKAGNPHPEAEEKTIQIFCREELFRMRMAGIDPGVRPFELTHEPIAPGETIDPVLFGGGRLDMVRIDRFWEPVGGFVITVRNLQFAGEAPEPALEEPALAPGSPGAVVQAFWTAIKEKRYTEAEEYLSAEELAKMRAEVGSLEAAFKKWPPIGEVVISSIKMPDPQNPHILIPWDGRLDTRVGVWYEMEIGGEKRSNLNFYLIIEDGAWKIDGS